MKNSYQLVNNIDAAIAVMHEAGKWLVESSKNPSKWWKPENLTKDFLLQYAKPDEFYVVMADGVPAAAAIFQTTQNSQDWNVVDGTSTKPALYIHWFCVARAFAGLGMPATLVDFAQKIAKKEKVEWLRVDTNAEETKLRNIYEQLGFVLVAKRDEGYRKTAYYQMIVLTIA